MSEFEERSKDEDCFFSMHVTDGYGDEQYRDFLDERYYDMTFDEFRDYIKQNWCIIETVKYTYNGKGTDIVADDDELKGKMTLRQFYNKEKEMNDENKKYNTEARKFNKDKKK